MYDLLSALLPYLEQYHETQGEASVAGFSVWLRTVLVAKHNEENRDVLLENCVSIINLYRYARHHAKSMLGAGKPFLFDDFGYLIQLFPHHQVSKMDLIERNIHEKSTGMEIIKRLVRNGLLAELENPSDKRSKVVSLTALGIAEVQQALVEMQHLTITVNGNLNNSETLQLNQLLSKLDAFHWGNFERKK